MKPKRLPTGVTYNKRAPNRPYCVRVRMPDGRRAIQYFATSGAASEWRDRQLKLGDRMRIGGRITIADTPEEIPTFAEWAQTYTDKFCQDNRTLSSKEAIIKTLNRFFGSMRVDLIDIMAILDFKKARSQESARDKRGARRLNPNTVNRDLGVLRHMLNCAVKAGVLVTAPPIELFPSPAPPVKCLHKATDREALLTAAETKGTKLAVIVGLAMLAGFRKSEILRMKWSDVRYDEELLVIESSYQHGWTKSGKTAVVGLHPRLRGYLEKLYQERSKQKVVRLAPRNDYIFPGNGTKGKAQNPDGHLREFERLVKELKLNITLHSLRHTFLTMLAQNGASAWQIMKAARHSDIKTSQLYVHMVGGDVAGLVKSL